MKRVFVIFIQFYQRILSRDTGLMGKIFPQQYNTCVFYPTCSEYTKQAIMKYGSIKGLFLGFRRISRCHPWQTPSHDELV